MESYRVIQNKNPRYDSLDIFRGLCIFFMIFNHSFLYLGGHHENNLLSFLIIDGLTCFFSAATFLTIAGISNGISLLNRSTNNNPTPYIRYIIRGIFMISLGLYVSGAGVLVSQTSQYFNYDILYLMGFISFIIPLLNYYSDTALISMSVFIAICTPLIRRDSGFMDRWSPIEDIPYITKIFKIPIWATCQGEYLWEKDFQSIFEGLMYFGYFPIFPFLIFFIIGIYFSRKLFNNEFDKSSNNFLIFGTIFMIMGFILSFIGGSIKNSVQNLHAWYGTPLNYYPISFSHLICEIGSVFIFIVIFHKIFDSKFYENFFLNSIRITGKFSLSFYCYSYTIIYGTSYVYHLITQTPLEDVYCNLLPGLWPIAFALCCWSFLSFIFMTISIKFKGVGTLEHLLGILQKIDCGFNQNDERTENTIQESIKI